MSIENTPAPAPRTGGLSRETSSAALLLAAAAIALTWANSPWRGIYERFFAAPLGLRVGGFTFERDLRFWINDGLMAIFFFTVGLEIKRELSGGELRTLRRAALPALAALGGMLAPAGIYLAFNAGTASSRGWGIPMATDIAFAVGVLALLGRRASPSLRITLLALAVIDDLGAVVVIAVVFSSGIPLSGLVVVALGLGAIQAQKSLRVQSPWAYVPAAVVTWIGAYAAGVHPTLAGVAVGLMTPASPAERLEHAFQPWVAFAIMPLFALGNAGVGLGQIHFAGETTRVFLGVALGLLLGKPIGVIGLAWIAVRLRLARLPEGNDGATSWTGMLVLGMVAGTGFTMSLFMTSVALDPGPITGVARLAVLAASAAAACAGVVVGRIALPPPQRIGLESARETTS